MGRTTNHSIETALVREKAEQLSNGQLADEILRCKRGVSVGANKSARDRFARRLTVMETEANHRMNGGTR
jgi:hypothetical protein